MDEQVMQTERIGAEVPSDLARDVRIAAATCGRSIKEIIAEAIAAYDEADGPSDDLGDAVYATEQAAMARLAAQEVQS